MLNPITEPASAFHPYPETDWSVTATAALDPAVALTSSSLSRFHTREEIPVNPDDTDYTHIERTYDEGWDEYTAYHKQPHEYIEPERQQFIERLPPGSTILDCGCGPGMDTERFSGLGYRVSAIDLSERFVRLTRQRAPAADVRKMDMRHLEFPPSSFDGLWASFSLLHIRAEEIDRTLSGFKTVLRPGGLFFAALHRGPLTVWAKKIISGMERDTYVQEWRQEEIEAIVDGAGFSIITSRPFVRTGGRYPLLSILGLSVSRTRSG
jgi:SAM-dependent methyltransferase